MLLLSFLVMQPSTMLLGKKNDQKQDGFFKNTATIIHVGAFVLITAYIVYKLFKKKPAPAVQSSLPAGMRDTPCSICLTDAAEIKNPVIPACGHALCREGCYSQYIQEKTTMAPAVDGTGRTVKDAQGRDILFPTKYHNSICPVCQQSLFPNNIDQQAPRH